MIDHSTLVFLMSSYGLWILTPLAVVEGPIVTLIAGYLARLSMLSVWQVIPCVVIADILGDSLLYLVGRLALGGIGPSWRERVGLSPHRLFCLMRRFRRNGTRILVAAKLTHAAGFAALAAAGAARVRFAEFVAANALAGIPKCLLLVAVGYIFGDAYETAASWLSVEATIFLLLGSGLVAIVLLRRRKTGK